MDVMNFFLKAQIVRPSIIMHLCFRDDTMFNGREGLFLYMYKILCFVEPSVHYHSTLNVALFYSSATLSVHLQRNRGGRLSSVID